MNSVAICLITLLCLVVGTALGMWLQYRLPGHHLSKESQETVKLGSGMVATMSALVLGLLVSSAKTSFDTVNNSIQQNGAKLVQIDHLLASYGPEAQSLRAQLKAGLAARVQKIWSYHGGERSLENSTDMLALQKRLHALAPANDSQKNIVSQCLQISSDIWQNRLLLIEEQQTSLPTIFLVLLVFWLTLLFLSFGLFAPRNVTVLAVLFVCAVSVSSAVFLVLEMNHPLDGIIKVSSAPLLKALELMGQ